MRTKEYLENLIEKIKPWVPPYLFQELHESARGHAGGKAYPKPVEPPDKNERKIILSMPSLVENMDDNEVLDWLVRLDELYKLYQQEGLQGLNAEDFFNAFKTLESTAIQRNLEMPEVTNIPEYIAKIQDVESYNPKDMRDDQLRDDWRIVCAWWANKKQGKDVKLSYAAMEKLATQIIKELINRKAIEFHLNTMTPEAKDLTQKVFRNLKAQNIEIPIAKQDLESSDVHVDKLLNFANNDFVIIPEFITLVGSSVSSPETANDMDILIKQENRNESLEVAIRKQLDPDKSKDLHFIYEPTGPHADYLPLWDLVARTVTDRTIKVVKQAFDLNITFLGTRGEIEEYSQTHKNQSSILFEAEGYKLLVDFGPGNKWPNADCVLITHAHPDHYQDNLNEYTSNIWCSKVTAEILTKKNINVNVFEGKKTFGPFEVLLQPVTHSLTAPANGYYVIYKDFKIAVFPDVLEKPDNLDKTKIYIGDGASSDKDLVRYKNNKPFGHASIKTQLDWLIPEDIPNAIFTHFGKWAVTIDDDKVLEKIKELSKDRVAVQVATDGAKFKITPKEGLKPIQRYIPTKPYMAGYTDTFSADELWNAWASKKKGPFYISPKVDGLRCILQKSGEKISIYFEDSKEEKADKLPVLCSELKDLPDFIIEGELCMANDDKGKFLARPQIVSVLADNINGVPYVFLYDLLYFGDEDLHKQPFYERLAILKDKFSNLEHLIVLPQIKVTDKEVFLDSCKKALEYEPWTNSDLAIEGVVARIWDMPYTFGATDDYAKFKLWLEIKVKVVNIDKTENGWVYECALRQNDKDLVLGKTFVTKEKLAEVGDTLNVKVEEIILNPDGTISWGKPYPQGVDRSRPAYTVEQVIDMARRKHFLKVIQKAEDIETRSEISETFWNENWFTCYPKSGKGYFTYQHHWRGLSEEEAGWDEAKLLETDHSVHGDLRFSYEPGWLFGFTVFLRTAKENKEAGGDLLVTLKSPDNLQGGWKQKEPAEWLNIARNKPYVAGPKEVGSTSQTFAKFFEIDHGTYEIGVWREHSFELFLQGDKLKGRFIIMYAPVGGSRKWLIDKPDDQVPYAEKNKPEDVLKELKAKGQRYLIWSKPGEKPKLYDLQEKAKSTMGKFIPIAKVDEEKRLIYGIVMEPDAVDSQGDWQTAEEIEKACHKFMIKAQRIYLQHTKPLPDVRPVENYIAPQDLEFEFKGNKQKVKKGSWIMVTYCGNDSVWQLVKSGKLTGYSVRGEAFCVENEEPPA